MKKLVLFTLLASVVGTVGCKDKVFKPNSAIVNVQPDFAAQGRAKTIRIQGDFTNWSTEAITSAEVSFGADITVDQVIVANRQTVSIWEATRVCLPGD